MLASLSTAEFEALQELVHRLAGIHLAPHKREMLGLRLQRRLRALGLTSFEAYYNLVALDDPSERQQLINCITTNKTSFFRESHHFEFLRDQVFPALRAADRKRVRLWSAGCSTGEEAYTLAITALEHLGRDVAIEIVATDIDTNVLAIAHAGEYSEETVVDLSPAMRAKYFTPIAGGLRVRDEVRALVSFRPQNLVAPVWSVTGTFDAIFCRNVVIYFDRKTQIDVFHRMAAHLASPGYLVVGHSEGLTGISDRYENVGRTVYRPKSDRVVREVAAPITKVLVVHESLATRQLLRTTLALDSSLHVAATAADAFAAWDEIKRHRPDVVVLHDSLPGLDGIAFLAKLMTHHPLPVVVLASQSTSAARARDLGAVAVLATPLAGEAVLRDAVCTASRATPRKRPATTRSHVARPASSTSPARSHGVIAVGASTGGTEAIRQFLAALPADAPGVLIVQHMPARFTRQFAQRLDASCRLAVREAEQGCRIEPGVALLAPGGRHLRVVRQGTSFLVALDDQDPVNRHRPSVDVLFQSCARTFGRHAVGVILTGMGSDGAHGLRAMRAAGAHTIAQDEASSVVFGMPREAIAMGAAIEVLALDAIAPAALAAFGPPHRHCGNDSVNPPRTSSRS